MISSELKTPKIPPLTRWVLALALLAPAWWWSYTHLTDFADALLVQAGLTRQTALGEAVHFFFFDTPKVLLLLTGVVFVMGVVQTFFAPERTRALLAGKRAGVGNVPLHRQTGQERLDVRRPQLTGMTCPIGQDEPPYPSQIRPLGTQTVMTNPQTPDNVLQQAPTYPTLARLRYRPDLRLIFHDRRIPCE